jgi:sec-independent protein translocase protein TatC
MKNDRVPPAKEERAEMGFLDHLEELRWALVRSAIAVAVAMMGAFFCKEMVFDGIILAQCRSDFATYRMLCALGQRWSIEGLCLGDAGFTLQNITMSGQFMTHVKVSLFAGFVLAFPFVFWQIWRFVSPGLHAAERKAARGAVFFASLLFFLGVAFGYYLLAPLSIQFLGSYKVSGSVGNSIALDSYIGTITSVTLWTGLLFQLPLVLLLLARIGLLGAQFLRTHRKHAVVCILVLAAIITPPDVASQLMVTLPLVLLFELSILLVARAERRRERQVTMATIPAQIR